MSQIMKAYMALFLLLLMAVSAMGIVTAQMQLIQAENMHKTFMTELAGCNLDSRVMENCFEHAKDMGCNLCITFYNAKKKVIFQSKRMMWKLQKLNWKRPFSFQFFNSVKNRKW